MKNVPRLTKQQSNFEFSKKRKHLVELRNFKQLATVIWTSALKNIIDPLNNCYVNPISHASSDAKSVFNVIK